MYFISLCALFSLRIVLLSFVLAMLKCSESLHWPFSPGIAFIWCLLLLLFQAVD